jgi:ATP-binding cassette, subfamily C, bacterial CydCD
VTTTVVLPPPAREDGGRPGRRPPIDRRLLELDPSVGRLVVVEMALALLTAVALIGQATAVAAVVARTFLDGATLTDHGTWLLVLVTAVVVRAAAAWASDIVGQRTAATVKSRLRVAAIDRLLRRDPGPDGVGGAVSLLTDGIDALDGTFAGYLPSLVQAAVIPVALVAWVLAQDPASAGVLAVTLPLIPLFMVLIGLAASAATRRRFRALLSLSGHLLEVLEALPTVRLSGATQRVGATVREAAERLRSTTLGTLRLAFLSALVLELLAALGVAAVAVIGGVRLAQGVADLEPVLLALLLAPEAFWPLRRLGQQFHANEEGARAAERLLDLVSPAGDTREPAPGSTPACRSPAPDPARVPVSLAGVTVTYPGRPLPALDRVGVTLRPGERTVVVGASGAGKSTLARVLLGLEFPDSGRVAVGPVPLELLAPDAWAGRVAWVPQDPADLGGSVREVLALGCAAGAAPSEAALVQALSAVGLADEVAALPDGLDTRIGPGGRRLSSGQRHRLALARALLRPAGLLVLDEPTGDLDVDAERCLWRAVERLRGVRTVVLLTHRIALTAGADQVVVLVDGRVAEVGRPERLRAAGGAFADLVAASAPLRPDELTTWRAPLPLLLVGDRVDGDVGQLQEPEGPQPAGAAGSAVAAGSLRPAGVPGLLRSLLRPQRGTLALAVGAGALAPVSGALLVVVSIYLLSAAALRPNLLDLTVAIVAVRALSLLRGVARYVERLAGHDVALRTVVDLRSLVYQALVPRSPAGLARHRVGEQLARIVGDVDRLQLALVRGLVPVLAAAVAAVVLVGMAGWLLPAAVPVVVVGLLVSGVGVPCLALVLARGPQRRLATARGELAAELAEVLPAAAELRLLGQLPVTRERLGALDVVLVGADRSSVARGGGADAAVRLTTGAMLFALVIVGVPAVSSGSLSRVLLGSLLVIALAVTDAVGPLPDAGRSLTAATTAAGRLQEVLTGPLPTDELAAAVSSAELPAPPHRGVDLVDLVDVGARYPGCEPPAVEDVTLSLRRGARIAVVGRSGAGKSTIGNLAVRFLDASSGEVRLDGTSYRRLAGDDIRRRVTLAAQDAQLVEGTIASNLRLAAPAADDEVLFRALEGAQLAAWVRSLPAGLDTPVGERGWRLSGGQRHRLALARALLVGAPLLVLDEPTADLDPSTGRAFLLDALRATSGRGLLLLTHDLRALPVVDEVVVLDEGRVVARGPHHRLLSEDADYRDRWELDVARAP